MKKSDAKEKKPKPPTMLRACAVTLQFLTAAKQRQVSALLEAYRAAVNFYIPLLWALDDVWAGSIDLHAQLTNTRLTARYCWAALNQARGIVVSTRASAAETGVTPSCPNFNGGGAILDAKFIQLHLKTEGTFDLWIELSPLAGKKGRARLALPSKRTAILNQWLAEPGAELIQGGELKEDRFICWVRLPLPPLKTEGEVLGIDVGVHKLIADSDGRFYGTDFKAHRDRVRRRKPGSKGKHRARCARDQFVNRICNQLPWDSLRVLGLEDLRGIKTGKKKGRGKTFRKAMAPWVARRVSTRCKQLGQADGVRIVEVAARGTSRTCPVCGKETHLNRRGEHFRCVACGYTGDADTVGALNVFARTLTILRSMGSRGA